MRVVRSNGRAGGSSTTTYGASHAKAASRDWTSTVSLYPGSGEGAPTTGWSEEDQKTVASGGAPYATAVRAGVQVLAAGGTDTAEAAEETVPTPGYLVAVDHGQDAQVGDMVKVTANPDDTSLVDQLLRVDHVVHGSERFQRDLLCTLQGDS